MTATEAIVAGQVTLTVRRLQLVPPHEVLYSLPTICVTLPALGAVPAGADGLQLHEDGWRQVELASRSRTAAISAGLDAIRQVYTDHGRRDPAGRWFAFDRIHRRSITSIAQPLSWPHLRGLLSPADRMYRGVQFPGAPPSWRARSRSVLRRPDVYRHLVSLAGDARPTPRRPRTHPLRSVRRFRSRGRGARPRAPADHPHRSGSDRLVHRGHVPAGQDHHRRIAVTHHLAPTATHAGILTHVVTVASGHSWQFASTAFAQILPPLVQDFGPVTIAG